MKAIINISGEISPEVASLTDVIAQFKAFEIPTSIEVNVDSVGGYVSEGDAIHDYLKSLKLPITTIAKEKCMSIATKVFLVGDIRKVEDSCSFMIHNPFLEDVSGDADYLAEASKHVRAIENSFMKYYSDRLGLPIEAIKPLAKRETYLNSKQLLDLGFATEIIETSINQAAKNFKAVAKLNIKMSDNKEVLTFLERIEQKIMNFGKGAKAELILQDEASGQELIFPDLEPDQTPGEGDTVTAEDGTYTVSGVVMVVQGGKVVETEEAESMDDEKEQMKKEMEEMKSQLEKYESESKEKEEELAKFKAQAKMKAELEKQLKEVKAMVSGYDPEEGKRSPKDPTKTEAKSSFKEVLNQLKKK